CMQTLEFSWTF
nr:immunoglobulin light chain junction region [Macaca mulatta]